MFTTFILIVGFLFLTSIVYGWLIRTFVTRAELDRRINEAIAKNAEQTENLTLSELLKNPTANRSIGLN